MQASIDIGTNTVLLLVAERCENGLNILHEEQRIPRLGEGVDAAKNVSDQAIERVINALNDYKKLLAEQFPSVSDIRVMATSAVRDAANRDDFVKMIYQQTGFKTKILSGAEEAKYTFLGARAMMNQEQKSKQAQLVLDIGGGSTEMALGKNGSIIDHYSHDLGCVRFTERYLLTDPPTGKEIKACKAAAEKC